jgi:uncharacterized protein YceK
MKKILLLVCVVLLSAGCSSKMSEEDRKYLLELAKTNAEITKICKESGKDVVSNEYGLFFCKP